MESPGGKTDLSTTLILIDELRARGVTYYKNGDVELHLGPVVEKDDPEVDNPAKLGKGKVGKDGLTAAQQVENYGRVFDAED